MLKKMTIKSRLLASFSVILLIAILLTGIAIFGLKAANDDLQNYINQPAAAFSAIQAARINTNVGARLVREMLINPDTSTHADYEKQVNETITELKANIATLKASYLLQDGAVEEYETVINDWLVIAENAIAEIKAGNDEKAGDILIQQCAPALAKAVTASQTIYQNTSVLQEEAVKTTLRQTNTTSLVMLILLGVAVVGGISLSLGVTRSLVKPLAEVEHAALEMAKGNLKTNITYVSKDAVGQVAEGMRRSMGTIGDYIDDIDHAMGEMSRGNFNVRPAKEFIGDFKNIETSITKFILTMSSTINQINMSSQEVRSGSEQIAAAAQTFARGSSEQAAAIEQLSANVEEISTQIRENANNAGEANHITERVGGEIEVSNQQMQQMMIAISEISESSREIGKIIKTIEDIAFQTNILALNAAVEAARAGAAGKGFAVVADEVRNLASKSADASKNTTALIARSIKAVDNGTKIAKDTASSLGMVVEGARQVSTTVDKIAKASAQQASSVELVTQNVDSIASVIQMNSSSAQQSAAASEELSGQADVLNGLIDRFEIFQPEAVLPENHPKQLLK